MNTTFAELSLVRFCHQPEIPLFVKEGLGEIL
jgi:hypothetical protein